MNWMILLAILSLVFGPSTVSTARAGFSKEFVGVGYQPYHTSGKGWGDYTQAEVEADMQIIAQNFKIIRTWTVQYSNIYIVPAAVKYNISVYLGAWLFPGDDSATKAELDKAVNLASQYPDTVKGIIVGNECLVDSPSPDGLLQGEIEAYMEYVRTGLRNVKLNIPVTTCQKWGVWAGHVSLADHVDNFIFATIYPFWDKAPIWNAINQFVSDYNALKEAVPNKTIVVGETGWPSQGPPNGAAVPGIDNERQYFQQYSQWASNNQVTSFIFEMFDEPWKGEPYEAHFGLYTTDSNPKFALGGASCVPSNFLLLD